MHLIRVASIRRLPASFRPFACFVTQRSFAASAKLVSKSPVTSRSPGLKERLSQSKVNLGSDQNSHDVIVETKASFWLGQDELYLLAKSGTLKLPFAYLRDACICPSCKDPLNKSRSFRTSDIPKDIRPKWVRWGGSDLSIRWTNDIPGSPSDHTSVWSYDFLKQPIADPHDQRFSNAPLIWSNQKMTSHQHWVSFKDYVNNDFEFSAAMYNLKRMGLIFLKDIPNSREMLEKIATRMGPLRNTFYGSTFDVRTVPKANNVAYTNQFLGFHMDLMYMTEPPGYQLLHCLENSCSGGESLFADAFRAAAVMREEHQEQYKLLSEQCLGYEYNHEHNIYYNERPIFELDSKTKDVLHVNYSPPFQSVIPSPDGKNHDPRYVRKLVEALDLFAKVLESEKSLFEMKLKPGMCVIFNNRRIVHARRQFNTSEGSRWLVGGYVDTDALLSRFAVSKRKHPEAWLWKSNAPASESSNITQTA